MVHCFHYGLRRNNNALARLTFLQKGLFRFTLSYLPTPFVKEKKTGSKCLFRLRCFGLMMLPDSEDKKNYVSLLNPAPKTLGYIQ